LLALKLAGLIFSGYSLTLFFLIPTPLHFKGIDAIDCEWPKPAPYGKRVPPAGPLALGELTLLLSMLGPPLNCVIKSRFLELTRPAKAVTFAGF